MQDLSIEVHIAGRVYPLRLKEQEAETARRASELINETLRSMEQRFGVRDMQDLFAMASLQLVTQLLDIDQQSEHFHTAMSERITALHHLLETSMPESQ
jgi:cell division protein ZapA (FtsZ GTPase activity inhibitor)